MRIDSSTDQELTRLLEEGHNAGVPREDLELLGEAILAGASLERVGWAGFFAVVVLVVPEGRAGQRARGLLRQLGAEKIGEGAYGAKIWRYRVETTPEP